MFVTSVIYSIYGKTNGKIITNRISTTNIVARTEKTVTKNKLIFVDHYSNPKEREII